MYKELLRIYGNFESINKKGEPRLQATSLFNDGDWIMKRITRTHQEDDVRHN